MYQDLYISILVNTVRLSDDRRLDDTPFGREHSHGMYPVHSKKAGPGEVMTVQNIFFRYRSPHAPVQLVNIYKGCYRSHDLL